MKISSCPNVMKETLILLYDFQALMQIIFSVCHHSVGTRTKHARECEFEELHYSYIAEHPQRKDIDEFNL